VPALFTEPPLFVFELLCVPRCHSKRSSLTVTLSDAKDHG
jgi:hypothetical protein